MRKREAVPMATQDTPNLYERLGGVYGIATLVDDLIDRVMADPRPNANPPVDDRSEEHTSELQSQSNIVCRLLLEKKNNRATCSLRTIACPPRCDPGAASSSPSP